MRTFGVLYDRAFRWSRHTHTPRYLSELPIAESSILLGLPSVILIPIVLIRRGRAWYLEPLTTGESVLVDLSGYLICLYLYFNDDR